GEERKGQAGHLRDRQRRRDHERLRRRHPEGQRRGGFGGAGGELTAGRGPPPKANRRALNGTRRRERSADPELTQLLVQALASDAEGLGGVGLVVAVFAQGLQHEELLHLLDLLLERPLTSAGVADGRLD